MALDGADLSALLTLAKARAGARNTVLAIALIYRAFGVPLSVATSLGTWVGFAAETGNPGSSAEELEAVYGSLVRSHIERLRR